LSSRSEEQSNLYRTRPTYKQLNAPFGAFAMATLRASTKALASNDTGDATYLSIEGQIQSSRTSEMRSLLR